MRTNRLLSTLLALAALLLAVDAVPHTRAPERAVAVTFDDLPATPAGAVANDVASLNELTRKLLSAVRKYGVPAVGFVNEGKLFVEGGGPDVPPSRRSGSASSNRPLSRARKVAGDASDLLSARLACARILLRAVMR